MLRDPQRVLTGCGDLSMHAPADDPYGMSGYLALNVLDIGVSEEPTDTLQHLIGRCNTGYVTPCNQGPLYFCTPQLWQPHLEIWQ